MRIVSRYLLVEFLLASGAIFLALLVTWIGADTLLHIDELTGSPGEALRGIVLHALDAVPLGIPMACMTGIVWSLSRAVRYREVTAIRCGGIPLRSALVPILITCVFIAGALAVFQDRLLVPTRQAVLSAEFDETKEARRRPRRLNDRWWYASGPSVLSAASYEPDRAMLLDVTLFQNDPVRHVKSRIDAESALNLDGDTWEFRNARVLEFKYPDGIEERQEPALRVKLGLSREDLALAVPPPEASTLHKLTGRLRDLSPTDPALPALETSLHSRIAQPLAVLVLVLLAIPFAIGDVERGDSLPRGLLWSVAAASAFWLTWTLALLIAKNGRVPPALPVWGLILLFLAAGWWRFRMIRE